MLRRTAITGALAALAAPVLPALPARAGTRVSAVMSTHGFVYLPSLVAERLGHYAAEGIDIDIVTTGGESKSLAALVGGGADLYVGSPSTSFRARAGGTDVLVIGPTISQYASNFAVSGDFARRKGVTEASPYADKLAALRGATIAITAPGSGTDLVVRFLCKRAGLNPDRDVTITALGTGETMTAALVQGRIDGFTLSAPAAENVVRNHGGVMLFDFGKGEVRELDGFLYIGLSVRQSWAERNPETVVGLLKAQQRALDAIHDPAQTARARDAVREKYHPKVEKAFFDYVWAQTEPAFPRSVVVEPRTIERIVAFVNEFERQPLDPGLVAKGWTDAYARRAVAALRG